MGFEKKIFVVPVLVVGFGQLLNLFLSERGVIIKYKTMKRNQLIILILFLTNFSIVKGQTILVLNSTEEIESVIFVDDTLTATYILPVQGLNQLNTMVTIFDKVEKNNPKWNIEIVIYSWNNRQNVEKLIAKAKYKLQSMGVERSVYFLGMPLLNENDWKKYVCSASKGNGYPNLILSDGKEVELIGPISGDMSSYVPKSIEEIEQALNSFIRK